MAEYCIKGRQTHEMKPSADESINISISAGPEFLKNYERSILSTTQQY